MHHVGEQLTLLWNINKEQYKCPCMLQYSVGNAGDLDVKPTALFVAIGESLVGRPAHKVDLSVVSNRFKLLKNKIFTCSYN